MKMRSCPAYEIRRKSLANGRRAAQHVDRKRAVENAEMAATPPELFYKFEQRDHSAAQPI